MVCSEPYGTPDRSVGASTNSINRLLVCTSTSFQKSRTQLIEFVSRNTGALVSRLVVLLDELAEKRNVAGLSEVLWQDQWEDFRCYIAHLWAEKKSLDAVLAESEQLLRQTYGYTSMRNDPAQREKADALLEATQWYAREIAEMPEGIAELADSTGFSPEGVRRAMSGLRNLEERLRPSDWAPESLFGSGGKIAELFGVMLRVPQLKQDLEEISGPEFDRSRISEITRDWVNGRGIEGIAKEYFKRAGDDEVGTGAITDACRAIYRTIVNAGTWGMAALSQTSGMDFDSLSEADKRRINAVPAMIYHGVRSEEAVLMRMNSAPRTAAEGLATLYREFDGDEDGQYSIGGARRFLKGLGAQGWDEVRPEGAALSGTGYKKVWEILSGEAS